MRCGGAGGAGDTMVCNEFGVAGGAVGVTSNDVDDGGLFCAVDCGDLV